MSERDFQPKQKHCEHEDCPKPPQYRVASTHAEYCKEHLDRHVRGGETTVPLLAGFKLDPVKHIQNERPSDLSEFIGKTMRMMCGTVVKIEKIQGSVFKPTRFEVNNQYHIVMLDAYKQLNNDKSITQSMIDKFDKLEVEKIEKVTNGKTGS